MKTGQTKKRQRKLAKALLIAAVSFPVLMLIVAVVAAALIFSKEQIFETPLLPGDLTIQAGIANRILPTALRSNEPGATARIELAPEEVNALLRVVTNAGNIIDMFDIQGFARRDAESGTNYRASYELGKFHIDCSVATNWATPFGSHVLVHAVVVPALRDREITMRIDAARVGLVSLMSGTVEKLLASVLNKTLERQDAEILLDIVHELHIDRQHNLIVVYYPTALKDFLLTELFSRIGRGKMLQGTR